jgi:hypothetical protein
MYTDIKLHRSRRARKEDDGSALSREYYNIDFYLAPDAPLIEGEIQDFDPIGLIKDTVETGDDQHGAGVQIDVPAEVEQPEKPPVVNPDIPDPDMDHASQQAPESNIPDSNEDHASQQAPESPLSDLPELTPPPPSTPSSLRDRDKNWSDPSLDINILPSRLRARPGRIVEAPTAEEMHHLRIEGEPVFGDEEVAMAVAIALHEGMEPQKVQEIPERADRLEWEAAMRDEVDRLIRRGTWRVVKRPTGVNIVGSKWVFRLKKNANGEIQTYRARLVAQGFTQVEGVDYFDTYSPVAKLASICTILALAARLDWEIHQVDVRSAYLYGELTPDEVIYMRPTGCLALRYAETATVALSPSASDPTSNPSFRASISTPINLAPPFSIPLSSSQRATVLKPQLISARCVTSRTEKLLDHLCTHPLVLDRTSRTL